MVATAVPKKIYNSTVVEPKKKYISWQDFQRRYLTREDSYKYEWLNSTIEKTPRTMKSNQFGITPVISYASWKPQKDNVLGLFQWKVIFSFLKTIENQMLLF